MRISDLPRPGVYARAWRHLASLPPNEIVILPGDFPRPAAEVLREFRRALHRRINTRGNLQVAGNDDQLDDWRRDRDAIRDYRLHRIVLPGSGLITALGRRIAPDVHDRFRERDY